MLSAELQNSAPTIISWHLKLFTVFSFLFSAKSAISKRTLNLLTNYLVKHFNLYLDQWEYACANLLII